MSASDIVTLDALDLSRAIRARDISCREAMEAYLDQIERLNPIVNAIVSLRDPESLIAEAGERDDQIARGEYLGWMHGFPHAVKDLALTAGIRTTMGSPLFKDFVPRVDQIIVERLRGAGAIIIGKTNVPEFGLGSQTYNRVFGTTLNAYHQKMTPGGSSGGAASALALRMLPVADGSDMGGSLRNPAAFSNLFGFRPSFGRVPFGPALEVFFNQLAYEGPMARTVPDLAALLSTMAGADSRAPLSHPEDPRIFSGALNRDFRGTRLGWLGDFGSYLRMEEGILELCRAALQSFVSLGCIVDEAKPDCDPAATWSSWTTLRHWLVAGGFGDLDADHSKRSELKPELQWEIERGLSLSARDVFRASQVRTAWYQSIDRLFDHFDYLLLPAAQVFPFDAQMHWPKEIEGHPMDTYHRWMEACSIISLLGCPAISVPVGFNRGGLPMGMQIVGHIHADLAVLQLAHAYDQATHWVRGNPPRLIQEDA